MVTPKSADYGPKPFFVQEQLNTFKMRYHAPHMGGFIELAWEKMFFGFLNFMIFAVLEITEFFENRKVNLASKKIQKLREHNRPPHTNKVREEALEHV